jgi:hypothetical protein
MDGGQLMAQLPKTHWQDVRRMAEWNVDPDRIVRELIEILESNPELDNFCGTCYAQPGQLCLAGNSNRPTDKVHKPRLLEPLTV